MKLPDEKSRGCGWLTSTGRRFLDRLLSRSSVADTQTESEFIAAKISEIEKKIDDSTTLIEKKLEYLQAKIDAYADANDRSRATLPSKPASQPNAVKARIEPAPKGQATTLVEVLGPSGVGKSTIIRAAQAMRTPRKMWYGPDEVAATISAVGTSQQALRATFDGFSPADFVPRCLEIVGSSGMLPSQKISAARQLQSTCQAAVAVRALSSLHPIAHDELLLHRAATLLLYSDALEDHAVWYFGTVPVPEAAIVIRAGIDSIVRRVKDRSDRRINTYYNLDDDALREIVGRSVRLSEIAAERLRGRGVVVTEIDADQDITESARKVHEFVCSRRVETSPAKVS